MPHITYSTTAKEGKYSQKFCNLFCVMENGCWEWHGSIHAQGHGQFHPSGKERMYHAHRYSYELFKDEIPKGKLLDHLCRNRKCVNPDHLEVVTHEENLERGYKKLRLDRLYACYSMHLLNEKNIGFEDSKIFCKECKRGEIKYEPIY